MRRVLEKVLFEVGPLSFYAKTAIGCGKLHSIAVFIKDVFYFLFIL